MTDAELERLREAFLSESLKPLGTDECPEPERIWAAADGKLDPLETGAVLDHVSRHSECAEAWRLACELSHQDIPKRTSPAWYWAAAAAFLMLLPFIWRAVTGPEPAPGVVRQPTVFETESLVENNAPLPRTRMLLQWQPGPESTLYRVRLLTMEAELVSESDESESPTYLVPESHLDGVLPGATLIWQVDAVLPDGTLQTSNSFTVVVR